MVDEELPVVEIDGKSREVISVRVDERDSVVYVTVKPDGSKQRSKSDDEPVEGRDDDNDGGDGV